MFVGLIHIINIHSDTLVMESWVVSRQTSVPQLLLCTKVTELHVTNNYKIIQYQYYKLLPVIGPSGGLFSDAVSNWIVSCQW